MNFHQKTILRIAFIFLLSRAFPGQAMNYHELEVYGYQTEAYGMTEIENVTQISNGVDGRSNLLRNTTEVNYGVADWMNLALYFDSTKREDDAWEATALRIRDHMKFFEKGELPVDFGAYIEIALPQNNDKEIWELEFKAIIEKDFGRVTLVANPIIEFENEREQKEIATNEFKTESEIETFAALSLAAAYRFSSVIMPKISFYDEFKNKDERVTVIQPTVDLKINHTIALGVGAGFGLTDASEKRLYSTKLEIEF